MTRSVKLGNILVVVGVLAWTPFLALVARGDEPSIFPFLAVHLTGVIGGSRLRAYGRGDTDEKTNRRYTYGRLLILLGVLAWSPYLYQKHILDRAIDIGPFLLLHLVGVLGGIGLILTVPLGKVWNRAFQREQRSSSNL